MTGPQFFCANTAAPAWMAPRQASPAFLWRWRPAGSLATGYGGVGVRPTLLRAGGLAAAVGMTTALIMPGLVPSVLGFTLFGLGLANMIPILFGAAGGPGA